MTRREVGSSRPLRDQKRIAELFAETFAAPEDEVDAGYGFDLVRLSILAADRDEPYAPDFSGDALAEAELSQLIDRIGARLHPYAEHFTPRAQRAFQGVEHGVRLQATGPCRRCADGQHRLTSFRWVVESQLDFTLERCRHAPHTVPARGRS